ncbi:MAG: acyl--CoA ligase [Alphaproteobacteria bacterium]|nr:acyl--CoA ligase [Alphaproteobacteria bacterium]
MAETTRVSALLDHGADDAPALKGIGRPDMTYGRLRDQCARVRRQLAARGIGPGDRVAIVLPNGPEMAAAFLAVASGASAAPLNPAYKESEFAFYLEDLKPKLVIVQAGDDSPVRAAASGLDLPMAEIAVDEAAPAGAFDLWEEEADATLPEPGDEALVLHTSGTTSRPKIVPLTQANLHASGGNIATTLKLTPADHCLNIMPLFHIHGLIAVVLSSMKAGASVCCTPGFNALKFLEWAVDQAPTWYSGVPTMHQTILLRAKRNPEAVAKLNFRFVRSSSASLPPAVFHELGETFGCPVIEAYGMTEATHQMTSNPLPPGVQKPGFVGLPAGPDVAILDAEGAKRPQGETGEVCIKGPNVTPGYENNPTANAESFTDGWFRTGDQGYFDAEGYLKITGRIKEIINRGGEKVSPLEVDDFFMDHPAVQQIVTFAMPHKMLGEEVAAAVVLAEGASVTEQELKAYAADKLAPFKIPKTFIFLDEIPKGATGKMQRIGLAEKLGVGDAA